MLCLAFAISGLILLPKSGKLILVLPAPRGSVHTASTHHIVAVSVSVNPKFRWTQILL